MEFLIDLWLPILIATVALFFASSMAWMILPHHFNDKKKLPCEEAFMKTVKELDVPTGNYMFPYAETKAEQGTEAFQSRYVAGPRGCLDIYDVPSMGKNIGLTVLFFFITTTVVAYITHFTCPPGGEDVDFLRVFRIAGTIGVLTHASSGTLNSIWFTRRRLTDMIDGVVYGLILAVIFAALWPSS